MSEDKSKSFWEEIQGRYEIMGMEYTPAFYLRAGFKVTCKLVQKDVRPDCPYCGGIPNIHAYLSKELHFGTMNGVPVYIKISHCRYQCKKCQNTFMEKFDHLPWHSGISEDARRYIISKLGLQTFTELASDVGICVQTIANIAQAFGESERKVQLSGRYRYLSMDEVFITRNENGDAVYYWLLNDISTPWKSNNIRVDKGRNKEDVIERLRELAHPETVLAVCIDMWKPYRDAICEALPNAAIVVDPFHVIQLAQKAMDEVRKSAKVDSKLKSEMKKNARLLFTSMFKLSGDELDTLERYLQSDPNLEKAYFHVQELMGVYRLHNYDNALNYLASWESDVVNSGIDEMISVLQTVQNWLPYIMNYFVHRITNGKTEGKNHLLRVIDKMGFHYGLTSIQACLYAHDRKQEYLKWKKRLRVQCRRSIAA